MRFFAFTSAFLLSLIMSSSVFASPVPGRKPEKASIERPRPARNTMEQIKNGDNGRNRQQREDLEARDLESDIEAGANRTRPLRRRDRGVMPEIEGGGGRARPGRRDLNSDSEARDLESDIEAGAHRARARPLDIFYSDPPFSESR
jgi:hypothetical protein